MANVTRKQKETESKIEGGIKGGTKKRRRTRTDHPGVKLKKRKVKKTGYVFWLARFTDPDTRKTVDVTLDKLGITTREARRQWAIRKSEVLTKRRAELATGAPVKTSTAFTTAVDDYLKSRELTVRDRTLKADKDAIGRFSKWTQGKGIERVEELAPAVLVAYRESRIAVRRHVQTTGKRGARKATTTPRSPATVNHELRPVLAMLNQWRRLGLLAGVHRDDLSEALKQLPTPREAPDYLPADRIGKLLESALGHDRDLFKVTRKEHAGLKPIGTTAKHEPIAPFVAFLLLSGARAGEALALRWSDVNLDALDEEGRKVGEIRLSATATKTKQYRTISLEVSPALHKILSALKLRAGDNAFVFGGTSPLPRTQVEAARKRLVRSYGAPRFSWQNLRQTCGTFLTNSPGIYGAASVFMSARQLGHSVAIAERHYLGVVRGIGREARNLEAAMQIEDQATDVVKAISEPPHRKAVANGK